MEIMEWLDLHPCRVGNCFALRAFTSGDGVVIQPPVYHPFAQRQARLNDRVVNNRCVKCRALEIDFEISTENFRCENLRCRIRTTLPGRVLRAEERFASASCA